MRTLIYLLIFLVVFPMGIAVDTSSKTVSDMYRESYIAQMRRQTGQSLSELRAEEYRRFYEVCDRSHNCTRVVSVSPEDTKTGKSEAERNTQLAMSFINVPMWH